MAKVYWLSALAILLLFACKKPHPVNAPFDVEGLNLQFTDTISLQTSTIKEDALRTDNNFIFRSDNLAKYLLGSMNDPVFGKSYAGIFTQLRLSNESPELGSNPVLDSVVLTLKYNGTYGNYTAPQTLRVYELSADIDPESEYFSDKMFAFDPAPVGEKSNFTADPVSEVPVLGDTLSAHLRVRLDDSFGEKFLDPANAAFLEDNAAFIDFFKGLYIAPATSPAGEAVFYFHMRSALSKLTLYYHNDEADSLTYDFLITEETAIVNHFAHDYNNAAVEPYIEDTTASQIAFIQGMAGLKTKIIIPALAEIFEPNSVLINKAELVITQINDVGDASKFPVPEEILLIRADAEGDNYFVENSYISLLDQFEGVNYYGGGKETATEGGESVIQYKFNMARHVQQVIDGRLANYPLYLIMFPPNEQADRLVIGGGAHPQYKMKINLYYTKID